MFNAGDTPSKENLHNISRPPENRTPIPLLSPLACHPAPSVFRRNTYGDLDDSPLSTQKKNPKHPRHEHHPRNWANEMDKDELFGQTSNNSTPTPDHQSGIPHPASQLMDTLISLRTLLLSSISEAKVTAQNILILTKTSSITEPLITDEVLELLNIITGVPPTNFPHKGAQSDKQILETLTKLTKKVDKLSEQVNKPKKVTSNHREPTEGLEASKHVPHLLTKSYAQAANTAPKNSPTSNRPPTSQNPRTPNPNKAHDPTRLVVCFSLGTNTTTREDNLTTVNNINRCLKENGAPDKLAITTIKWNHCKRTTQ